MGTEAHGSCRLTGCRAEVAYFSHGPLPFEGKRRCAGKWRLRAGSLCVSRGEWPVALGNPATGRKGWHVSGRHTAGGIFAHGAGSGAEVLGRLRDALP